MSIFVNFEPNPSMFNENWENGSCLENFGPQKFTHMGSKYPYHHVMYASPWVKDLQYTVLGKRKSFKIDRHEQLVVRETRGVLPKFQYGGSPSQYFFADS